MSGVLIPELIQHAVTGKLRFDFIESTVSVMNASMLSSLKGRGHSDPADGCFHYHFLPRGPLASEWTRPGGYLDAAVLPEVPLDFYVGGVERGSANWTGSASALRLMKGAEGPAVHARVQQWSRSDQRSVHSSFVRVVIPGKALYPTTIRHTAGIDTRVASVAHENAKIDFRDYGHYTEICAYGSDELPASFAECTVSALGLMLERDLGWVYSERHADRQRMISVQVAVRRETLPDDEGGSPSGLRYDEFWKTYSRQLAKLL